MYKRKMIHIQGVIIFLDLIIETSNLYHNFSSWAKLAFKGSLLNRNFMLNPRMMTSLCRDRIQACGVEWLPKCTLLVPLVRVLTLLVSFHYFFLFVCSTSSCSHAPIPIGRPSSYPPSSKGSPQVSDVSPLSLSTTPPEVSAFYGFCYTI